MVTVGVQEVESEEWDGAGGRRDEWCLAVTYSYDILVRPSCVDTLLVEGVAAASGIQRGLL